MSIDQACSPLKKSEKSLQELLSTSNPFEVNPITTTSLEVIEQMHSRNPIEKIHQWNFSLRNKFKNSLNRPDKLQQLKQLVDSISKNTYVSELSTEINQFTSLLLTIQNYTIPDRSAPIPIRSSSDRNLIIHESESDSEVSQDKDEVLLDLFISLNDPTEVLESLENLDANQAMKFINYIIQHPFNTSKLIYIIASLKFENLKELLKSLDCDLPKVLNNLVQTSLRKAKNPQETLEWFKRIILNNAQKFADSTFQINQLSETDLKDELRTLMAFQTLIQNIVEYDLDIVRQLYSNKLQ